jgi:hypothetical protein
MMPKVFLCEPSALTPAQRLLSDQWHERLFGLGFEVDQLRSDAYQLDPWAELMRRMSASQGVLVLGFTQLLVSVGNWRRGTEQEVDLLATWTSPWMHVETGMALATRLPVLVAPESGVREGVFESATWTGALHGTSLENPDARVLDEWARAIAPSTSGVHAADIDQIGQGHPPASIWDTALRTRL